MTCKRSIDLVFALEDAIETIGIHDREGWLIEPIDGDGAVSRDVVLKQPEKARLLGCQLRDACAQIRRISPARPSGRCPMIALIANVEVVRRWLCEELLSTSRLDIRALCQYQ